MDAGALFCWGKGTSGQLGTGDAQSAASPRPVAALHGERVQQAACGMAHTLALTLDGTLFAWGQGADGQLGLGGGGEGEERGSS